MRIGDFQQIAQSDQQGRIVKEKDSKKLKVSSFKGRVLSRIKPGENDRNREVKSAFLKSIRETYGDQAVKSAEKIIGKKGKPLLARDVRTVLSEQVTVHRTHGTSGVSKVRPALEKLFDGCTGLPSKKQVKEFYDATTLPLETRSTLQRASKEQ
ncbi:MAG: hypothetical protein AAGA96_18125, partial [Verrucomicrobiota bacterium]